MNPLPGTSVQGPVLPPRQGDLAQPWSLACFRQRSTMPLSSSSQEPGSASFPPLSNQILNTKTIQAMATCQLSHLENSFLTLLNGVSRMSGNQASHRAAMSRDRDLFTGRNCARGAVRTGSWPHRLRSCSLPRSSFWLLSPIPGLTSLAYHGFKQTHQPGELEGRCPPSPLLKRIHPTAIILCPSVRHALWANTCAWFARVKA